MNDLWKFWLMYFLINKCKHIDNCTLSKLNEANYWTLIFDYLYLEINVKGNIFYYIILYCEKHLLCTQPFSELAVKYQRHLIVHFLRKFFNNWFQRMCFYYYSIKNFREFLSKYPHLFYVKAYNILNLLP